MDRLQHITSVAYLTFRVCRHFGLDYRKGSKSRDDARSFSTMTGTKTTGATVHTATGTEVRRRNAKLLCGGLDQKKVK